MKLQRIILLVVLIGANHAAGSSRITRVVEMLTNLHERMASLEQQQTDMRNFIIKQSELTNQALTIMNSELVECEGNDRHLIPSAPTLISQQISHPDLSNNEHQEPVIFQKSLEKQRTTSPVHTTTSTTTPTSNSEFPNDCSSLSRGMLRSSIQTIYIDGEPRNVLCDAKGSIVLMRRYDGSLHFNRTLQQYSDGFGDLNGEFWTGLNDVHRITSTGNWTLRINLEQANRTRIFAEYTGFSVGAGNDFTLNFDENSYRGTAGDALRTHHGWGFSTFDHDVDELKSINGQYGNCVDFYGGGGWWFRNCFDALLTGGPYGRWCSIQWLESKAMKGATMSIKRN